MGDIRAPHSTTTGDSTTGVVATDSATGAPGALAADSATGVVAADSITEALAADSGTRVVAPDSTTGALAAGSDTGKRRGRRNLIRPLFGAADDAGKGKGVSSAHDASLRSATLLLEAEDPALRSGAVSDTANRPSRPDPATPPPEKAGAEVAARSASGKRPRRPWNSSTSATPPASSSPAGTALSTTSPSAANTKKAREAGRLLEDGIDIRLKIDGDLPLSQVHQVSDAISWTVCCPALPPSEWGALAAKVADHAAASARLRVNEDALLSLHDAGKALQESIDRDRTLLGQ